MPDARSPDRPRLLFFISGHGFGHASRDVEVINALARRRPDLRLLIRSDVNAGLLARTIRAPYELRPGACDTGIVQTDSVTHDNEATVREAVAFYRGFDRQIEAEVRALAGVNASLIVADIPPLAFEVAARLGVPSVAMANFTWDWVYEWYPALAGESWLLDRIRTAYAKATLALELPFAGGFDVFPAVRQIPLVARHPARSRQETRAHFGLAPERRVALLSFGGYGLPALDVAAVDCLDAWTILTTDRVRAGASGRLPANVIVLPETAFAGTGFRYEDLVAAVDVVVTKPGYGILAESIACGTPMLYTSRGRFREYGLLVREMPRVVRCRFIDQTDLFAGRWRAALDALTAQPPPPETMPTNGAGVAAEAIAAFASAGRTPAAGS